MSQSHVQIKVGIFVLFGLVLLGALTILFSRSTSFYKDYYELRLKSANVGGIKAGAKVLMRGVQVGSVKSTQLNEGGRSVMILLRVESSYKLYSDARFEIETAGVLGDQFVAIYPTADLGTVLTNHAEVEARPPFNMQEAVAVATEMLMKISQTTTNLNAAVSDVRRLVLTEEKLKSLGGSLERIGHITADAETTIANLSKLVSSNAVPISAAVSNLNLFSTQLPALGSYVHSLVASNEVSLNSAVRNLESTSASLTNLMADLESGRGTIGRLLQDDTLAANLGLISQNLAVTTSNLNTRGLWGIMWKQKIPPAPKTNAPAKK